ncbi:MAG: hypothetical protein MUO31_02785 [Thermodesulfovibrionales bacterium]|nr:hypothetical protein [Thermodesulfovibrionales bacterium]
MTAPRYSEEKEYETLRAELLGGKKYVFERPILIITAALASFQLLEKDHAIYLAPIVIWLLSFNLWFSVNRMGSIARIAAYIQLVLEDGDSQWFGWETSLRKYRKWLKNGNLNVKNIQINDDSVYDNLGYYPVIFYVHVFAIWLSTVLIIAYAVVSSSILTGIIACISLISSGIFTIYALKNSPRIIRPQIEQNRQIWKNVFKTWSTL